MRTLLRSGLALLALTEGIPALWAALFPASFYSGFPTPDRAWLTLFPPYNEHLTYDFGLVALQFVVNLGYAAVVPHPGLVRAVLLGSLVFTVPHCFYHQQHVVAASDLRMQLTSQIVPILLALVLLVFNEKVSAVRRHSDVPRKEAA